jgi:hypothetical protein
MASENLTQTKATLEMSLKSSAELLKQLSLVGNIEDLHKLEQKMQESMHLIEKLKTASKQQQDNNQPHEHSPPLETNQQQDASINKLRLINSMPCMTIIEQNETRKNGITF